MILKDSWFDARNRHENMVETQQRIGHIRLTEMLGEGGMGTVWRGYDEKLRRKVAVKTLRADRLDLQTRARLLAEARILSQLEHPNICRLYDYVEGERNDYLVLELIRGRTLGSAIASGLADAEKLRLGFADKLRIAEEIARTLVVAHARGIVHRDLKPSNVMLVASGDGARAESGDGQVKVLDFGLARSVEGPAAETSAERPPADAGSAPHRAAAAASGTLTRLGSIVLKSEAGRVTGTPANMSPEQARGEGATAASDMYSFGPTAYGSRIARASCQCSSAAFDAPRAASTSPRWRCACSSTSAGSPLRRQPRWRCEERPQPPCPVARGRLLTGRPVARPFLHQPRDVGLPVPEPAAALRQPLERPPLDLANELPFSRGVL